MSSAKPSTNNITQIINKRQATRTPAKLPHATESAYESGKVIVEDSEESFDEALESSSARNINPQVGNTQGCFAVPLNPTSGSSSMNVNSQVGNTRWIEWEINNVKY